MLCIENKPIKILLSYKALIVAVIIPFFLISCNSEREKKNNDFSDLISGIEKDTLQSQGTLLKIDSLYRLASAGNNKDAAARSFYLRGSYYYTNGNFPLALQNFHSSAAINYELNDIKLWGELYDYTARAHNRLKQRDSSVFYFKKAIEKKEILGDSTGMGESYHNIGFVFSLENKFDSSVFYYEKALALREKLTNKEHLSATLNNIGTVYYHWSLYDQSLRYYIRALYLARDIDDYTKISLTLTNIGIIYKETGNVQKAKEYFSEALTDAKKAGDKMAMGYAYNMLASTFTGLKSDSAIFYYSKSLENYKAVRNSGGIIIALKGLGENYIKMSELEKARLVFLEILSIAEYEHIPLRTAEAYKYLGEIKILQNDLAGGRSFIERSITLSEQINVSTLLRDNYLILSRTEEKLGDNTASLAALQKYLAHKTIVDDDAKQKQLNELKSKFEFEKYKRVQDAQRYENEQQRQYLIRISIILVFVLITTALLVWANVRRRKTNKLLEEKNGIIEENNRELQSVIASKDRLFSIIAHDLKNPFFIFLNFSEILREDYKSLSDQERMKYIGELAKTANSTYQLLENLLDLSSSRTGDIEFLPENIELKRLFDGIIKLYSVQLTNKKIKCENLISGELSAYADRRMMEVVFRNLINNAIKYTDAGGKVEVDASLKEDSVIIEVKDNGTGMSEDLQNALFGVTFIKSTSGTGGEKGTGLGLSLCKEFVMKNDGEISVSSRLGEGSVFTIVLPGSEKSVKTSLK